jgi:hypothetical protein
MQARLGAAIAFVGICFTSAAWVFAQTPASLPQAIKNVGLPPMPQPTSAFVDYCRTNSQLCQKYITITEMTAMTHFDTSYCIPDSAMGSGFAKQIAQVKNWIAAHSELAARETSTSILSAYRAIYPPPKSGGC